MQQTSIGVMLSAMEGVFVKVKKCCEAQLWKMALSGVKLRYTPPNEIRLIWLVPVPFGVLYAAEKDSNNFKTRASKELSGVRFFRCHSMSQKKPNSIKFILRRALESQLPTNNEHLYYRVRFD